jgi:predicted phosphodiesterase
MNILVLSDLHIDASDRLGTFQWDQTNLIRHMERIRELYSIQKIIFNGDTFEHLKYKPEEIKEANGLLIKYFQDKDFIFINGNHDMLNSQGLGYYQITNSSGQVIHIEHGHNADWYNGSRVGRSISKYGFSLLKKLSGSKSLIEIYFKLVASVERLNSIPEKYNTLKYLTYALRLLKDYDVVILAHTHKLESHHTYYLNKKKRYLNCGSCSLGRFQAIVLDTETLKYELIKETRESINETYQMSLVS